MSRRRSSGGMNGLIMAAIAVLTVIVVVAVTTSSSEQRRARRLQNAAAAIGTTKASSTGTHKAQSVLDRFISENRLTLDDYPDKLLALLDRNPEAEDFVLNYPLKKGNTPVYSLRNCIGTGEMPKLYQWDERWGYNDYGGELMGLSGCGPTALSMVCLYLLGDELYTPAYVADYSVEHGYRVKDNGTAWALMSDGAADFGLNVTQLKLSETQVMENLEAGNPVICVVGPGIFTDTGHFLVLSGIEDGKIHIHDPNSPKNTQKLWDFDEFSDQIKNIWAYTLPEEE